MKALYSWERDSTMQRQWSGVLQSGEKLCTEGVYMRTKGEGLVKSNTEELGGWFECKGCQS